MRYQMFLLADGTHVVYDKRKRPRGMRVPPPESFVFGPTHDFYDAAYEEMLWNGEAPDTSEAMQEARRRRAERESNQPKEAP